MIRFIWFILPVFIIGSAFSPFVNSGEINELADDGEVKIEWVTFEEAIALNNEDPKMIFIDFYTDWCSWCKKMDANTFSNPQIAALMTDDFYAVKFNAEKDVTINFREKEYGLNKEGRRPAHEIAIELATHDQRLGYPTFVVLDENFDKLKAFQGYKTVDALKQILEYYGDKENYTQKNWMQFVQGYQTTTD